MSEATAYPQRMIDTITGLLILAKYGADRVTGVGMVHIATCVSIEDSERLLGLGFDGVCFKGEVQEWHLP